MLKIPKGLKKKKKGKKSKHKEDELFDSAELEEYRRQQQAKQQEAAEGQKEEGEESANHEESEEWLKFKALTSGVDDILKKTQGDLDRIKSTSFFQKKPPGPSEPPKAAKPVRPEQPSASKSKWVGFGEVGERDEEQPHEDQPSEREQPTEQVEEHVEEEEEESDFDDDQDDIFDTSYVDVVASGEVKLAYIPDSPIEDTSGPDPFDTSIVEKVIKVDPKEQKRNLITLGCAVDVLSGKLEKSPVKELSSTPRRRPKPQDLLLGSFDEGGTTVTVEGESEPPPKSILDDDPVFEEETSAVLGFPPVTPLAESKPICTPSYTPVKEGKGLDLKDLVEEFVPLSTELHQTTKETVVEDELDDEFAQLAVESLSKKTQPPPRPEPPTVNTEEEEDDVFVDEDDPFDTTFATQVLPGKFELKLIEKEILESEISVKVDTVEEKINVVLKNSEPSIRLSKSEGPDLFEAALEPLSLKHRDLLGGSTTDLTKIDQQPIAPKSVSEEPEFDIVDPFDTSIAEPHTLIGKTELKFIEKELLDEKPKVQVEVDDEFDLRSEEKKNKAPTRPDNLSVGKRASIPKVVAFDVQFPQDQTDLLTVGQDENSKISKPLTPYYPTKQPGEVKSFEDEGDPFDTSFVSHAPGKAELKILEKELAFEENKTLKHSLSDPDFDPRGAQEIAKTEAKPADLPDILTSDVVTDVKLRTPVAPRKFVVETPPADDFDPFDTSIANTLVPGKAEIKLLENELIHNSAPPIPTPTSTAILEKLRRDSESSSNFRKTSVSDVLELHHEDTNVKPLTPLAASSSFDQDIDPFDTSSVGDILPGKTEIKLLESELMLN